MENRKLKICFLGDARTADIFTLRWVRYFSRKGHKTYLFSYFPFDKGEDRGSIELHLIQKKFPGGKWLVNTFVNFPLSLMKIKKEVERIKPDIIHAHCVTSYGKLAAFLGLHPLVITAWGSDILINPYKNLITKLATKKVLKNADLLTSDAYHMKTAMEKLGANPSKIKIINFGVDTKKFQPGLKQNKLKKKMGIGPKDRVVISLRGLEPIYDVETLIRAAPIVLKKIKNVKFLILGGGYQEQELKNLSGILGVEGKVKFTGWIFPEKLPDFLRASDVYVSTSLSDGGLSSSTAEAMASGLPVIITDVADNEKWVQDGGNGFLVPGKSPKLLAQKILYLLNNKTKRKEFGGRSRKIIEERNDYCGEMGKMENIYQELVQKTIKKL